MERSLVLVKPDAMQRNLIGTIISRFEETGLKLIALKMLHMDRALAGRHYAIHKDKPFFENLITYITSSPIVAAVFEGDNAVEVIRKTMGATDPSRAEIGTIRGDYGLEIERNSTHGSDSRENADVEIRLFFNESEIFA